MVDKPIGVIDSGVGGLTVVHEIMRQLPNEQLIYIGDTKRCPYGSRPKQEVISYTLEMVNFLLQKDVKMIVIACNTATAFTLKILEEQLSIPVIGVIQPGARAAINVTKTDHVAVIGTDGTINSQAYKKALTKIKQDMNVISLACPLFVPMVEKGILYGKQAITIVNDSLQPLTNQPHLDTLILGCTHYPLLGETISQVMGKHVQLVSSSEETARETSVLLDVHHLMSNSLKRPYHEFYATGNLDLFKHIAKTLFNEEITNLKTVIIEKVAL